MDMHITSFDGFRKSLFPPNSSAKTDKSSVVQHSDKRAILPANIHHDAMSTFHLDAVFEEINEIMRTHSQKVTAHSYSATSVMTYVNDGHSHPKVYQASMATCTAPGGIRQTRKTLRDSHSGIEKISVGHHLGERARVIERSRNRKTGQHDEQTEYINMDEEDAPSFQEEWRRKTTSAAPHHPRETSSKQFLYVDSGDQISRSSNPYRKFALTDGSEYSSSTMQRGKPTET